MATTQDPNRVNSKFPDWGGQLKRPARQISQEQKRMDTSKTKGPTMPLLSILLHPQLKKWGILKEVK